MKRLLLALLLAAAAPVAFAQTIIPSGGGGSTSPGGSSGQIQYNNSGSFGGVAVTGTGSVVQATSPTLVTPTLGVATATTVNGVTIPSATDTAALLGTAQTFTAVNQFNSGDLKLKGATSGTITLNAAGTAGANTLTLPAGTTDFSATGGTSQVVKQTSVGGALTVARLACADLSDATAGCSGSAAPSAANPTASVGTSAVNGSASTFLRSDGAPAIDLTMSPTWTGAHTWSRNGALSAPTLSLTGTWVSGGSATTTKPLLLIEPAGTASTAWSGSGTGIGVNAASNSFILMDLQAAGSSKFSVSGNGIVTAASNLSTTAGGLIAAASNGYVQLGSDTYLQRTGAAGAIKFGGLDGASPTGFSLLVANVPAGTSNAAGADLTISGSQGTGTGAGGKIILQTAVTGTTGTSQNAEQAVLTLDTNQHVKFSSAATPVVSSCGTGSPAMTAGSTDVAGQVTIGTTATACTITFKIAYSAAPFCVVSDQSLLSDVTSYTVSTTAIVLTMTSNSGNVINYVCHGA